MIKQLIAVSLTLVALNTNWLPAFAEDLQPATAPATAVDGSVTPQPTQAASDTNNDGKAIAQTSGDATTADTNKNEQATSVAQASDATASDATKTDAKAGKAKAKSSSAASGSFTGRFVKSIVPFTTGVIIGTPIAVVRHSYQDTSEGNRDLLGSSKNFFTYLFFPLVTTVSLPFGCFSGALEGAFYGPWNSAKYADDKPYSKESFSLGAM